MGEFSPKIRPSFAWVAVVLELLKIARPENCQTLKPDQWGINLGDFQETIYLP
jgi:hypothetical protein